MKRILFLFLVFVGISQAATTYFLTQTGTTPFNGSSGAPFRPSDFNNSSNWSSTPGTSGKISPGDTVKLQGTISSPLTCQGSGSAGNVITILFDTGALMSAPYWTTGEAIQVSNCNYITVDGAATGTIGGVNGNPAGVNGIIESTANGTGLANQQPNGGVRGDNSSHITVKNLQIRKIYQRSQGDAKSANETDTGCIGNYTPGSSYTDYVVDNCILSDAYIGIDAQYSGSGASNFSFTNVSLTKCNWEIHIGGANNTAQVDGITVANCTFGNYKVWDDPAGDYHHNGLFIAPQDSATTGYQHNVRVHHNIFNDGYGLHSTAGVFMNAFGSDWDVVIYDNLFFCPTDVPTNDLVTLAMHTGTMTVTNNSVYAASGSGSGFVTVSGAQGVSSSKTFNVYNNASYNMLLMYYHDANGFTTLNEDNNIVSGTTFGSAYYQLEGTTYSTVAAWRALGFGWEASGSNANPLFVSSSNLHLQGGSPCIGAGVSQSSNYTTDFDGLTWSTGTGWGIGAYKYNSATPVVSSVAMASNGTTLTITLDQSCTTGAGGNGGMVLTASGGATTLTYSSGSGSTAYVYTSSRTIQLGETLTLAYTQPGNGIEATTGGSDLASFSGQAVTNNSSQGTITSSAMTGKSGIIGSSKMQ